VGKTMTKSTLRYNNNLNSTELHERNLPLVPA
jgi:hypothetical protein